VVPFETTIPLNAQPGRTEMVKMTVRSRIIPTIVYHQLIKIKVNFPGGISQFQIFLPSVLAAARPTFPDLTIENVVLTTTGVKFDVVNIGTAPVTSTFWIDGYINPYQVPLGVNETFEFNSVEGLVWGIDSADLPINPGQKLTLQLNSPQFDTGRSIFSLPFKQDMVFYLQVDSANQTSSYGGVLESHEALGGQYNNIIGPIPVSSP
jgi:hypothetical protein